MEQSPEEVKQFWDRIIRNEDGSLNEDQMYLELSDFKMVMNEVSKVYMHITNDLLSKITYHAYEVISKADECYRKDYIVMVKEFIESLVEDALIQEDCKKGIIDQIEMFF